MGFRSKRKRDKHCQNLRTRPSAPPPPPEQQPTSFLTLPSELRQQILLNSFEGTWSCIACSKWLKRGHTQPCASTQHAEFEDGEWRYRKSGWRGTMQPRHRGKMQATAWAEVLREIGYWVRDDVDVVDKLLSEEIEGRWEEKGVKAKWCTMPEVVYYAYSNSRSWNCD